MTEVALEKGREADGTTQRGGLHAYESYKPSNTAWFPFVPASWTVKPLRSLLKLNEGGVWGDEPTGAGDTVVLRSTDQTVDGKWLVSDPAVRALRPAEAATKRLRRGDLLVTKSSGSALHIGKSTLVDESIEGLGACFSNFMQRLRLDKQVLPKLVWYFLNSRAARSQLEFLSSTTTGLANLTGASLAGLILPVPPLLEQRAIAAFLDRETERIDAVIAKQERLIELLEEKRQAAIARAVTKGLDPSVEMKEADDEWLLELPSSWRIKPLRRLVSFSGGSTPSKERVDYWNGDIPWVSPKDMKSFVVHGSIDHVTAAAVHETGLNLIATDAVLLVVRGLILARTVPVALNSVPLTLNQDMKALRSMGEVRPTYLALYLRSAEPRLLAITEESGHGTKALRTDLLGQVPVCLPSPEEQAAIEIFAQRLEETTAKGVAAARGMSSLLREHRSSLIAAAVTGKIDLRDHATRDALDRRLEAIA